VLKASEGTLNIIDVIRNGWVQLIINTPLGQVSREDEHAIGQAAYEHKITYMTTLSAAASAAKSIEQVRERQLSVMRHPGVSRACTAGRKDRAARVARRCYACG